MLRSLFLERQVECSCHFNNVCGISFVNCFGNAVVNYRAGTVWILNEEVLDTVSHKEASGYNKELCQMETLCHHLPNRVLRHQC